MALVLSGSARLRSVTMAEARLKDGQRLLGFNDLFVGASSHISARYGIRFDGRQEHHSSSGIIVSTGAGSTGWLSSIFNEAAGIVSLLGGQPLSPPRMSWEDEKLFFIVREPFVSRHSQATVVAGLLAAGARLELEAQMPSGGVIFSDGMESDHLDFNAGAMAQIGIAPEKANLVVA